MLSADIQQIARQHPGYLDAVNKNYRWNFIALALDSSLFSFALSVLSHDTILPYFASQLTDSSLLVGFIPALYYLGFFFPQLLGAYLVHGRATRKEAVFWIAVSERVGIFLLALLAQFQGWFSREQALLLLFGSYALFSVTNGLIGPAYQDFISKSIVRRRGLFFGITQGAGRLVGFTAGLTAAFLLERYAYPTNLQYLFWLGFASSFASPFLIASFREVPFPGERHAQSFAAFIRSLPSHIREVQGYSRFILVRCFLGIGIIGNAFYALYALERFNLSDGHLGLFTLVILLSQSLLGLAWGWLGDRMGFKRIFLIAACLVTTMGILALLAPDPRTFYLIAACVGGGYAALQSADPNMVFELAPPRETSRFVGITNTSVAPVMTVAAIGGGFIVERFSYGALFSIVFLVGLASILLVTLYMPDPRSRA